MALPQKLALKVRNTERDRDFSTDKPRPGPPPGNIQIRHHQYIVWNETNRRHIADGNAQLRTSSQQWWWSCLELVVKHIPCQHFHHAGQHFALLQSHTRNIDHTSILLGYCYRLDNSLASDAT
jgi:hypothetical protein